MTWRRLARTLNPSRPLAIGFAGPSAEASTSGRSFEEAAAAAAPGAAGRLSRWLEAPLLAPLRRPVQINQGTLALLLLGSVALGSQVDRVAHAQQAGAAGGGGGGGTLWEAAAGARQQRLGRMAAVLGVVAIVAPYSLCLPRP